MCGGLFKPSESVSKTSSSTSAKAPYAKAYENLLTQAQGVATTPYDPATDQRVAGFSDPQTQAFGNVQNNQGIATPYVQNAQGLAALGSAPITGATIDQYMSPYQQSVIDATQRTFDTQNARQMEGIHSDIARQSGGANLGGSGRMVADALARETQMNAQNPVIAGLYNQGFSQAQSAAQADAARALQGAGVTSSLGGQAQQYASNDVNSLLGVGGMQQGLTQAQYDAASANAAARAAHPYQNVSWLSGISTGLGGAAGTDSTGRSVTPGPSVGQQLLGAAATGVGAYFGMSDERVKEDIVQIGQTNDGQPIYRYRFAGSPKTEIGLIAQEVEQRHPEAVAEGVGGLKMVNYDVATRDAMRPGYAGGGDVTPFGGARSYIPKVGMGGMIAPAPSPSLAEASAPSGGISDMMSNFTKAHSMFSGLHKAPAGGYNSAWPTTVSSTPSGGGFMSSLGSFFGFKRGGPVRSGYADGGDVTDLEEEDGVYSLPEDGLDGLGALPVQEVPAAPLGGTPYPQTGTGVAVRPAEPADQPFMSPEAGRALMQAGLGIMASRSPNLGVALGEGGLRGMEAYNSAQREAQAKALQQQKIAQSAAALKQRADQAAAEQVWRDKKRAAELEMMPLDMDLKRATIEKMRKEIASGGGATEYGTTPQWTVDGRQYVLGKDGTPKFIDLGPDAKPLPPGQLAEDKARGVATGKSVASAKLGLPQVLEKASNITSHLDALESDPYLNDMVGPVQGRLPNVKAAAERVQSKMDQITGAAFLQAFESLKGGGQITEIEGNKATAAISRLQNVRMSEADYRQAIADLKQIVRNGVIRAKVDAGEMPASALNDIYDVEKMGLPTIGQPSAEPQVPVGPGRSAAPSPNEIDVGDGFSVEVR